MGLQMSSFLSFKPYYNWNTFNTQKQAEYLAKVFDSFKPYYNWNTFNTWDDWDLITGLYSFKPYYNWNTFNTGCSTPSGISSVEF